MQSKTLSLIEAVVSTFAGFFISIAIQLALFPLMGMDVSLSQNILITTIFTLASIGRGYIIRRIFNHSTNNPKRNENNHPAAFYHRKT